MHTIRTTVPAAVLPAIRTTGSTTTSARIARAARLLSAWAERRLLGAPDPGRVPATPRRELPLPWS